MMRYWLKIFLGIGLVLLMGIVVTGLVIYRASQRVPAFYEQALHLQQETAVEAGDQFEQNVLNLTNDLQTQSQWQATFSSDQINGWLSTTLPSQYPGVLPRTVREPRVALDKDQAQLACRVESKRVSTVISLDLEVFLTEEPNELAIRVNGAKAGLVPVPVKDFLEKVTRAAQKARLNLRWVHDEGIPTALVRIPENHKELKRGVLVEALELRPGELFLSGRSDEVENLPTKASVTAQLAARQGGHGL